MLKSLNLFPDRFLDFTLKDPSQLNESLLLKAFESITEWIQDETGIEVPSSDLRFKAYENPRGNISIEGRLYYRGPMKRGGELARIKFDLTSDEKICCTPEIRKIYHHYSDVPEHEMAILSYSLEEIYAEKLRALSERLRPRDLYDVIHLHYDQRWQPDHGKFLKALQQKCEFKQIEIPTLATLEQNSHISELKVEWQNMLSHQVKDLETFESYWSKLPQVFQWIHNEETHSLKM